MRISLTGWCTELILIIQETKYLQIHIKHFLRCLKGWNVSILCVSCASRLVTISSCTFFRSKINNQSLKFEYIETMQTFFFANTCLNYFPYKWSFVWSRCKDQNSLYILKCQTTPFRFFYYGTLYINMFYCNIVIKR